MEILHRERKAQPSSKRQHAGVRSLPSPTPRISSHSAKIRRQISAGGSPIPPQPGNRTQTRRMEVERLLRWQGWQRWVTTALLTETPETPWLSLSQTNKIISWSFQVAVTTTTGCYPVQGLSRRARWVLPFCVHLLLFLLSLIFSGILFLHPGYAALPLDSRCQRRQKVPSYRKGNQ